MALNSNVNSNSSKPNEKDSRPLKILDDQRRYLAAITQVSYENMDNASCCYVLEEQLNDYSKIKEETQHIFKENLEKFFKNSNKLENTVKFQSKLDTVSQNILKPLKCSNGGMNCPISENFHPGELEEFNDMYKDIYTYGDTYMPEVSNKYLPSKNIDLKQKTIQFKTAREELQVQTMKQNDNQSSGSSNSSTGQKRKLGFRRNINSKFVSPLLSNNEGSKEIIDMDVSPDVNDSLKHIDAKMIELIKSEIMDCGPNLSWDDIAGLSFAKAAIQEAVVWPMLRPDIFKGLRRPPKAILLFGPPGTGKTLIGKCVASQSKSTFFSISASSLTSKWVGDGEKMVRALFAVARAHQPAVIFIDEIDSLLSQRSDTEHESSRRIKTEFLVQLDGASTDSEEKLLVIGATNRPQELDEAARRRFVKRLYIPLPDFDGRLQLVKNLISSEKHELTDEDFVAIANSSKGYSGADIKILCSEASLGPIRSIDKTLIEHISSQDVRPLQKIDFDNAFSRVKSSVSDKDLETLVTWDVTYGSGSGC